MRYELSKTAGFCPGVKRAVDSARRLAAANDGGELYMLGELVHNEFVTDSLLANGVKLAHDPAAIPPGAAVIVRAHGISPAVREQLRAKGCVIHDETCCFVTKVQALVAQAARAGRNILITGSPDHPEVIAVRGCAGEADCLVLSSEAEAKALDITDGAWTLVSQTTFSRAKWDAICEILKNKIANLQIFGTICNTTVLRQSDAYSLASRSDVMLVLGSKKSSNTSKLFDICRRACERTYWIDKPDRVQNITELAEPGSWRIGITAGASTPEEMIREVIRNMTEQEGLMNQEQPEVDFTEFIENIPELKKGSIVKGNIVRYDDDYVYVDVKDKSEGRIPIREFDGDPDIDLDKACEEHMELDVYVRSIRNSDMGKEINLSKARVDFVKHKEQIQKAYEEKEPVTVKVVNVVRDGVIAVYGSIDIYIHRTQLELSRVEDLEPYRGKTFDILVTQFDPNRKRMRVSGSRRSLLQRHRREKAREIWDTIEVGNEYDGVVRNLTNFGAFVDIGGVDGLVHISELSWQRIRHPSEVVSVGDTINVFVKDFDPERKRISLGFRREEDDPYRNLEERFPLGMIVRGVVVRMFPFGAFINIAPGVDALCHISQISDYRLNKPNDVLDEGMEVDARVIEVSDEARRISVSIREVEPINPDPESEIVQQAEQRQQQFQQRGNRRRGRRREESAEHDMPTTYIDKQASSSLSDVAAFTAVTKEGSELLDSVLQESAAEKAEKPEAAADEPSAPTAAEVVAEAAPSADAPADAADEPKAEAEPTDASDAPSAEEVVAEAAPDAE